MPLAMATVPLAGALLGFLRYNFNPATIFLGDCGSLLIGFLLGCFGLIWSQKSATMLGVTAPLLALAIARRFLKRQGVFGADRAISTTGFRTGANCAVGGAAAERAGR